jgi:hypothetical protein
MAFDSVLEDRDLPIGVFGQHGRCTRAALEQLHVDELQRQPDLVSKGDHLLAVGRQR